MKTFILFLLISISVWAEVKGPSVKVVKVTCPASFNCEERKTKFEGLKGEYRSLVHLRDTIRLMTSDGGYRYFDYVVTETNLGAEVDINFALKPRIREINIGFVDRNLPADPAQLINLKEGEYFESQRLRDALGGIHAKLEGLGFPQNSHRFKVVEHETGVSVSIAITLGRPRIFKSLKTNSSSTYVDDYLKKKFITLYNKPFDQNRFKQVLDEAQKELFQYGYYLISLDFSPSFKKNRVVLDIKVSNDRLFAFDFRHLQEEDRDVIHSLVKTLFQKYKRQFPESTLKSAIKEHYELRGHLNTEVMIDHSKFTNKFKETVQLYRITLKEGRKTILRDVTFSGNSFFETKKLEKMFDEEAFELASLNYYDPEYFNYFAGYLKNEYIKNGFVQMKIVGPNITLKKDKKTSRVEYLIQEGTRAFVRSVEFPGLPPEFESQVLAEFSNSPGKPFNPLTLSEDIKKVANVLQEHGYYYAEVSNSNEEGLVQYSKTGAEVDIKLVINAGQLVKLNRVILLGNYKCRKKFIMKSVPLEEGEIITPSKTKEIESSLSTSGLFNSVTATPMKHTSKSTATDLIVNVSERDYGLIEVAPGFRSDLGLKLTGTFSYLNLGGMNRALTLRSQVNQRITYQTLDARRRKEKRSLLEYNNSVTFTENNIFNSEVDYNTTLSVQRRRFFDFDADIQRLNNTFTRDLTKRFSSSLTHRFEVIRQFDATDEQDNGKFRIGAITSGITYDLRNNRIYATKGAFFNLSCEFANPYFLSQKNEELTVNYYKLISRNRFYIPFKNGTVAISMVGGVQENLAKDTMKDANGNPIIDQVNGKDVVRTKGNIPGIKVFRLTGMDIVRGFDDEEINKLPDNRDISKARVQNTAYLANFKLEPRYFINDSFMAGVFLDAGRVYVDNVDLGELRSSAGVTFKILTPVGTLDFDYGIKLLRKRNLNGSLESPGRFHVSIGFF